MRILALLLVLLVVSGCVSQGAESAGAPAADEGRASRASDGALDALVVRPGSPYLWQGSTDSCTGVKMPDSCTGSALDGSETANVGVDEAVQAMRIVVAWQADSDASRVLEVTVRGGGQELARASGSSPLELPLSDPPERIEVRVEVPEPEVAQVGDGSAQAFEARAEAVA
jgi:hypothetical protein